jgi:hypothetical protein
VLNRLTSGHLRELVEQAYQFTGHLVHDIPHHDTER